MKITIKLSEVLEEFTTSGGFFLCEAIHTILLKNNGSCVDSYEITKVFFETLNLAYPKIFRKYYGIRIIEGLFKQSFNITKHPEMGIESEWYEYEDNGELVIISDYKFKCALLKYLITTYGDCSMEFNV